MKIIKTDCVNDENSDVPYFVQSWCGECGRENHYLLEIGERADYDSATAYLCFDCINKALNVVKRQIPKKMRRIKEQPNDESNT